MRAHHRLLRYEGVGYRTLELSRSTTDLGIRWRVWRVHEDFAVATDLDLWTQ